MSLFRGPAGGSRSGFHTFVFAVLTCASHVIFVADASAGAYVWKDVNGRWTDPANWEFAGGGTNNGYPNGVNDGAFFTNAYSNGRTIELPSNQPITVGSIYFGGALRITLKAGLNSLLILDNGPTAFGQIISSGGTSTFTIEATIRPRSDLLVDSDSPLADIDFYRVEQSDRETRFIKRGPGSLDLFAPSTHRGPVIVEHGSLYLASGTGSTILGNLTIGDGIGAAATARVSVEGADQFAAGNPQQTVVVNADGRFDVKYRSAIPHLEINDGEVQVAYFDAPLSVRDLVMRGGVLTVGWNSMVDLAGKITTSPGATQAVPIMQRFPNQPVSTGRLHLSDTVRVTTTCTAQVSCLDISLPVSGVPTAHLIKDGAGILRFSGALANSYLGDTIVEQGTLQSTRTGGAQVVGGVLRIGGANKGAANVHLTTEDTIGDDASVIVGTDGLLSLGYPAIAERVKSLAVNGGVVVLGAGSQPNSFFPLTMTMAGGRVEIPKDCAVLTKSIDATSTAAGPALITGTGTFALGGSAPAVRTADGPQAIDLRIQTPFDEILAESPIAVDGPGVTLFAGANPLRRPTTLTKGTLLVTGTHKEGAITQTGGRLGGTGSIGTLSVTAGTLAPGMSAGKLATGDVTLGSNATFEVELSAAAESGRDRLDVKGGIALGGATLAVIANIDLPVSTPFTIVTNDGQDAVSGTFAGLAEGARLTTSNGREFTISYAGGDGNDVVLTSSDKLPPLSYLLAEGATGDFFDDDVLIANPSDQEAPITLTFLKEDGTTVVATRQVPARSRLTVRVETIPGLENASASVRVDSDQRAELVVERSMFWDGRYYGGHTANAADKPEKRWIFAEGFQGFFDTYVLIANDNADETTATLTFLRENATPVTKTVTIGPRTRRTIWAGELEELRDRAFGIVVDATLPVVAERSMYFATENGRLWTGGHANTGIVAPSTSWFHAEGATGAYFSTFILLSNPQDAEAHVEVWFLLSTGEVIARQKTIGPKQRLTINPAGEGDPRLENAALSTVVQSDVPIVSERSMYWTGAAATGFSEGHNSSGVSATALSWGLAEGRVGGERAFDTFILLANPSASQADVTITFLRESGAPLVKKFQVPATSRFNVDVKTDAPELIGTSFGARIEVTNNVPIAVERSLYWNALGQLWEGGTNALGVPLRP